jgi:hypothetical protein
MVYICFQVLHLGLKLEYFHKQGWEPEWIDNTETITQDAFANYKGLDSTQEDPDAILVNEVYCPIVDKDSCAHGFVDRRTMTSVIFVLVLSSSAYLRTR